jgi:hypothetical protein
VLSEDEFIRLAFVNLVSLIIEDAIVFGKWDGSERGIVSGGHMTGASLQSKAELSVLRLIALLFADRFKDFSDTLHEHLFFLPLSLLFLGPDLVHHELLGVSDDVLLLISD